MLLIKNILLDGKECDILVEGNRISRIADGGTLDQAGAECLCCDGKKVALPGFVNMHTHAHDLPQLVGKYMGY